MVSSATTPISSTAKPDESFLECSFAADSSRSFYLTTADIPEAEPDVQVKNLHFTATATDKDHDVLVFDLEKEGKTNTQILFKKSDSPVALTELLDDQLSAEDLKELKDAGGLDRVTNISRRRLDGVDQTIYCVEFLAKNGESFVTWFTGPEANTKLSGVEHSDGPYTRLETTLYQKQATADDPITNGDLPVEVKNPEQIKKAIFSYTEGRFGLDALAFQDKSGEVSILFSKDRTVRPLAEYLGETLDQLFDKDRALLDSIKSIDALEILTSPTGKPFYQLGVTVTDGSKYQISFPGPDQPNAAVLIQKMEDHSNLEEPLPLNHRLKWGCAVVGAAVVGAAVLTANQAGWFSSDEKEQEISQVDKSPKSSDQEIEPTKQATTPSEADLDEIVADPDQTPERITEKTIDPDLTSPFEEMELAPSEEVLRKRLTEIAKELEEQLQLVRQKAQEFSELIAEKAREIAEQQAQHSDASTEEGVTEQDFLDLEITQGEPVEPDFLDLEITQGEPPESKDSELEVIQEPTPTKEPDPVEPDSLEPESTQGKLPEQEASEPKVIQKTPEELAREFLGDQLYDGAREAIADARRARRELRSRLEEVLEQAAKNKALVKEQEAVNDTPPDLLEARRFRLNPKELLSKPEVKPLPPTEMERLLRVAPDRLLATLEPRERIFNRDPSHLLSGVRPPEISEIEREEQPGSKKQRPVIEADLTTPRAYRVPPETLLRPTQVPSRLFALSPEELLENKTEDTKLVRLRGNQNQANESSTP